jgi:hypothetical protein
VLGELAADIVRQMPLQIDLAQLGDAIRGKPDEILETMRDTGNP